MIPPFTYLVAQFYINHQWLIVNVQYLSDLSLISFDPLSQSALYLCRSYRTATLYTIALQALT